MSDDATFSTATADAAASATATPSVTFGVILSQVSATERHCNAYTSAVLWETPYIMQRRRTQFCDQTVLFGA